MKCQETACHDMCQETRRLRCGRPIAVCVFISVRLVCRPACLKPFAQNMWRRHPAGVVFMQMHCVPSLASLLMFFFFKRVRRCNHCGNLFSEPFSPSNKTVQRPRSKDVRAESRTTASAPKGQEDPRFQPPRSRHARRDGELLHHCLKNNTSLGEQ